MNEHNLNDKINRILGKNELSLKDVMYYHKNVIILDNDFVNEILDLIKEQVDEAVKAERERKYRFTNSSGISSKDVMFHQYVSLDGKKTIFTYENETGEHVIKDQLDSDEGGEQ